MNRTEKKTQVIILEHAPESTWKDVEGIHLVEEWRPASEGGKIFYNALIPEDWKFD